MTTFALIPAAGKSTRMGRPKLALPLGSRTVLENVIAALWEADVEHVLVVVGAHVPELITLAEQAGARVLLLARETADMRATIECGLDWLEEQFHPLPEDRCLLVPGDSPTLHVGVVRQLLQAQDCNPGYSLVVPTFQGRHGHPTLIGWKHVPKIRKLAPGQGINAYLRDRKEILEVPMGSAEILGDLDTPEDYERLLGRFG